MKKFLFTFLTLLSCVIVFSQEMKIPKFGKITHQEMIINACPIDTGAHAFVMFDKGNTEFVYLSTTVRSDDRSSDKGFQMKYSRHLKIKILDKATSGLADFEIPLYHSGARKEQIIGLKGFTYNLVNGKIEKIKLNSKQTILEKKDNNWSIYKFAMPDVREGSVIELYYEILSDFLFNLQEWRFQNQIPSLYSEYTVSIPEYFTYNPSTYGYFHINSKKSSTPKSITLTYIQKGEGLKDGYTSTQKVDYRDNITKYYASNIPAFKEEGFLRSPNNYILKIKFELAGEKFPNSPYRSYSFSWEDVNKQLLENENFGKLLSRTGFLNDDAKALKDKELSSVELMTTAYEQIKNRMKWDGSYRLFAEGNLKQAYDKGIGNSADINLLLVTYLRLLGIDAYPVAISTQRNGIIHISHASITSFNYVIALAVIDGKNYLMDATAPYSYINLLPVRCLNDKGRIIDEKKSNWIELIGNNSDVILFANLKLDNDGSFSGSMELKENGYEGMSRRSKYEANKEDEAFRETMEKAFQGIDIQDFEIKSIENYSEPVNTFYNIQIKESANIVNDMIFFKTLLIFGETDNPFKLEKRDYPVEFPYPFKYKTIIAYEIPEGYYVESLPKSIKLTEDKGFQFTFNISNVGNIIQVVNEFQINKTLFLPSEYESIKRFFATMVEKHNEQIVLKRK